MDVNLLIGQIRDLVNLENAKGSQSLGTWFLGPKGESNELLQSLVKEAVSKAVEGRTKRYPDDPNWANTNWPSYKHDEKIIQDNFKVLIKNFEDYCVPFSSYRYQGHMLWDQSLPAVVGYLAAALYNQNNVAAEASPLTTALEMAVADDLCRMVGFQKNAKIEPWGHITCDGSMANIEALWSGRNTKLFPFAVYAAAKNETDLHDLSQIKVKKTGSSTMTPILNLDWWEMLNLSSSEILDLPNRIKQLNVSKTNLDLIQKYTVQNLGLMTFAQKMDDAMNAHGLLNKAIANLKILGPASAHYSLPKACTLLGLGSASFTLINVLPNARMSMEHLEHMIEQHYQTKTPIINVVAVMGTTEESAVDSLSDVLELREKYRKKGMDFLVHADGAWGGYFASLINTPHPDSDAHQRLKTYQNKAKEEIGDTEGNSHHTHIAYEQLNENNPNQKRILEHFIFTELTGLNDHTAKQLKHLKYADSVTIDPHKSGFALYPAGSIVYKDHRMPQMIQVTAPVVYHGGDAPTVGVLGVEGSKPGAAAAGVYFSHKIIRPDQSGYGKILGRCTFHSRRVFSELLSIESKYFKLAALTELSEDELQVVRSWSPLSNVELWKRLHENQSEFDLFRRTGPDLNIISYAINPIIDGKLNTSPSVANKFNDALFKKLSNQTTDSPIPNLIVTSSIMDPNHSAAPIKNLRDQLKLDLSPELEMNFLITTVMNPWLSDADDGKRNMIPFIVDLLKQEAESMVQQLYLEETSPMATSKY